MSSTLSGKELANLVQRVFHPSSKEQSLAVLVDLPTPKSSDSDEWSLRRRMAVDWVHKLAERKVDTGLTPSLWVYPAVGANNADLPPSLWPWEIDSTPEKVSELEQGKEKPLGEVLDRHPILMALTEFSATAPLKLATKSHSIRAATMGGFTAEMVPALRLNYDDIQRRVDFLKRVLDQAVAAQIEFVTPGDRSHLLHLDLRFRSAFASGGQFREVGQVGNLPSGEAYIVPYEGELEGVPSGSEGWLPVQFGTEFVLYQIQGNRAVSVEGPDPIAAKERARIRQNPGYANLAELGLGVLADFGVEPCGKILLDEKLGLHIAFGRSDHFGGQVGADQFSSPQAVVHIDRVYIPSVQPLIHVHQVSLELEDSSRVNIMRDNVYVLGI